MLGMRSSSNNRSRLESRLRSALASTSSRVAIILLLRHLTQLPPPALSHGPRRPGKGRDGERSDVPPLSRQPAGQGAGAAAHAAVENRISALAGLAQPDRCVFLLGEAVVLRRSAAWLRGHEPAAAAGADA